MTVESIKSIRAQEFLVAYEAMCRRYGLVIETDPHNELSRIYTATSEEVTTHIQWLMETT